LKDARTPESGMGPSTPLIDVATSQTRAVSALIKAASTDPASAIAAGQRALDSAKAKLKDPGVALGTDLTSAVTALADAVVARDEQIATLTKQRDASVAQVEAAKEQQAAQATEAQKAIEEVRSQA